MIAVGVVLAIFAAVLGTTSKQLIAASEHYGKDWLFHLGATLNVAVGPVVDASAYAFAPQVIVAPLACLDVIMNAITAPRTLHWQKEELTGAHVLGVVLVTLGAVFTCIFAEAKDGMRSVVEWERQLFWRPTSAAYLAGEVVLVLAVLGLLRGGKLRPAVRGIMLGTAAGLLMGNVFFAKALLSIIRGTMATGDLTAWFRPTPYLLVLAALSGPLCGHLFMRKGLTEYKGVFMVTIFEGAHIAAACLSGCIVMEEMAATPWWRYLLYWCGVGFILLGLVSINTAAADAQLSSDDSSGDEGGLVSPSSSARRPKPGLSALRRRANTVKRLNSGISGVVMGSIAGMNLRRSYTTSVAGLARRPSSPALSSPPLAPRLAFAGGRRPAAKGPAPPPQRPVAAAGPAAPRRGAAGKAPQAAVLSPWRSGF